MDQSIKPTTEKLEMEKEFKEKLKLFIFGVRPVQFPVIPGEYFKAIVAYRDDDAVEKLKKDINNANLNIIYTGNWYLIESLLSKINAEGSTIVQEAPPAPEPQPAKMSKQQFINNLLLVSDDFVKDPQSKEKLKEIIKECQENI